MTSHCSWAANRLPHIAHGSCSGYAADLAESLQRLMDHQARVAEPLLWEGDQA